MSAQAHQPPAVAAAALPDELTIYTVGEWSTHGRGWLATVEAGAPLQVDGSRVTEIDSAGVQALVALANAMARRESRLVLAAPSAPLADALQRLGATFLLPEGESAEVQA